MSIGIGLGLSEFPFDSVSGYWRWVELCENSSVDSIWQTDRLINDMPMLESLTAVAALAGSTKRLKFGINVIALGWRDPLVIAKQCASIDFLSGGRLLPAFGIGTFRGEEWDSTGRNYGNRGVRVDEALDIIARLWAGEKVNYFGEYYNYRNVRICPLPTQNRMPLWIGGQSKAAIRRTARIGTGWIGGFQSPEEVAPTIAEIKSESLKLDRPLPEDHFGVGCYFRFGNCNENVVKKRIELIKARKTSASESCMVVGNANDLIKRIVQFMSVGITKFVLQPVAEGDSDIINQTKLLIAEVLPEVPYLNKMIAPMTFIEASGI